MYVYRKLEDLLLSIFVMYSNDREDAFLMTLRFLKEMPLYSDCQKILVVDGKINRLYEDWNIVEVPRIDNRFCWAKMWDAGVFSSCNENILYLDSDRILPKQFLTKVTENLKDSVFLYTSQHFMMHKLVSYEDCCSFLNEEDPYNPKFMGMFKFEPRFSKPIHGPSKNVMSGSTAFTKRTYIDLGGVDHWYCGHGAYADTDFHYQSFLHGCEFVDLKLNEIHYIHEKKGVDGLNVSNEKLQEMSLNNLIYYCNKWELPSTYAENIALKTRSIKDAKKYVAEKLEILRNSPRYHFE